MDTSQTEAPAPSCCNAINQRKTHICLSEASFLSFARRFAETGGLQSCRAPVPTLMASRNRAAPHVQPPSTQRRAVRTHASVHVCVRVAQLNKEVYQNASIYSVRYTCAVANEAGLSCNISSPEVTLNRMRDCCVNRWIFLLLWLQLLLLFRRDLLQSFFCFVAF